MIACELGNNEVVHSILEHFETKRKAKEQLQKEKAKNKKKNLLKKKGNKRAKKGKKNDSEEEDENDEVGEMEDDDEGQQINVDFLEIKNRSSWTALHFAVIGGNAKIVKNLLDSGAKIGAKTSKSMVSFKH